MQKPNTETCSDTENEFVDDFQRANDSNFRFDLYIASVLDKILGSIKLPLAWIFLAQALFHTFQAQELVHAFLAKEVVHKFLAQALILTFLAQQAVDTFQVE